MIRLNVMIEINGENRYVGDITGTDSTDACFAYADEYLADHNNRPISISLPLAENEFSPIQTKRFFEGLLPEGFTRKCVAKWIRADEADYITILSELGRECLGAIKIVNTAGTDIKSNYRLLGMDDISALAREGSSKSADIVTKSHLSLTGASGKVGLYYDDRSKKWYQPIGDAPSTHIVKQSHVRLKKIVANEQLCLLTARNLGILVPESFIVRGNQVSSKVKKGISGSDNMESPDIEDILFATKRYDRKLQGSRKTIDGLTVPFRLHQEDFAQAMSISSSDKYERNHEGYLKKAFDIIRTYSASPVEDQLRLWDICIFNYLIGNTDNHIKNISLIYCEDLKSIRLAPAYDIVSTMVYDGSTENMAFSIGHEYDLNKITRNSFELEAEHIGLGKKIAMTRFDNMVSQFKEAMNNAMNDMAVDFSTVDELGSKILKRGGIRNYL